MMEGSIELLQYYRQQSICHHYHRYGNLGERAIEYDSATSYKKVSHEWTRMSTNLCND